MVAHDRGIVQVVYYFIKFDGSKNNYQTKLWLPLPASWTFCLTLVSGDVLSPSKFMVASFTNKLCRKSSVLHLLLSFLACISPHVSVFGKTILNLNLLNQALLYLPYNGAWLYTQAEALATTQHQSPCHPPIPPHTHTFLSLARQY